jgi:hypothetical protein
MIGHHRRRVFMLGLLAIIAASAGGLAQKPQPSLTPRAIGQIVNEILDAVIPVTGPAASSVWKKGVYFDYQRTLDAFQQSTAVPISQLALRHSMQPGSRDLLDDCDQFGRKPCSRIGWATYIYLEAVAISGMKARVRLVMLSADRERPFAPGVAPTGPAQLSGGSTVVHLTRARNGVWKFQKTGPWDVLLGVRRASPCRNVQA